MKKSVDVSKLLKLKWLWKHYFVKIDIFAKNSNLRRTNVQFENVKFKNCKFKACKFIRFKFLKIIELKFPNSFDCSKRKMYRKKFDNWWNYNWNRYRNDIEWTERKKEKSFQKRKIISRFEFSQFRFLHHKVWFDRNFKSYFIENRISMWQWTVEIKKCEYV